MAANDKTTDLKRILVLYTGGTIGMQKMCSGVYAPVPNLFKQKIKACPELHDPELAKKHSLEENEFILQTACYSKIVTYQLQEYHPLLDSSNTTTKEWIRIAKDIEKNYNEFDGFVILHGTDTLAYTASILSFMFQNLSKPVVLTGAQVSIFETPTDAKNNFLSSLIFASCEDMPEVFIFLSNKLLRGNRSRKTHTLALDAFDSPNYHVLGNTGMKLCIYPQFIRKMPGNLEYSLHSDLNVNVGIFYFFPTVTKNQLRQFLEPPLDGMVLLTYGAGNISSHRVDLIEVLADAVKRGVVIVNVTQCFKGPVSVTYETGKVLQDVGVIPGNDITVEAAYAKLIVVLGMSTNFDDRVKLMKEDLRGEMTVQQ